MMKKLVIGLAIISGFSNGAEAQENKKPGAALTARQQKMVTISALTAKGELELLKPALNAGLDTGLTVNEIKEVMVQLYAYCGFPRSLRGLQTFMSVLEERKAKGITDLPGKTASPISDQRPKYERGKEVLEKLSGNKETGKPAGYAAFSPEIEVFLKEHLFADIFERDVLTYSDRELVTVSALIGQGGVEPMMKSHMGLFLNQDFTAGQLIQLVEVIGTTVGKKEADAANPVLREVLKSKGL
jgi:alkylhydroperoxidase/carboxymuconolactone decarboxylase family protein YurZ